MLLRRQCGASPSPKSIAWAWPRNARQSPPCPVRQSAVNGRNRVRRPTRPRAETAQGPAARGGNPSIPAGVFRFHAAPFFNCYKERSNNPGKRHGRCAIFKPAAREAAFFWTVPAIPYATPKRHPGDLRHIPKLLHCRARRQIQSPQPGKDTLLGLHRRPRPTLGQAPMGGVPERLWLHRRRVAGSLPDHALPYSGRHVELGKKQRLRQAHPLRLPV